MKIVINSFATLFFMLVSLGIVAQSTDTTKVKAKSDSSVSEQMVLIIKNDNSQIMGKLISKDAREVLLLVEGVGEMYVPTHVIREIKYLDSEDMNAVGQFVPNEVFSTRYFITTNGLPIESGEHYVSLSLAGPEIHFAAGENFGAGLMTSWLGTPIIGVLKATTDLGQGTSGALGLLAGGDIYGWMEHFYGALPFASLTFGDRKANFTLSGGYGVVNYNKYYSYYDPTSSYYDGEFRRTSEGRALFSVAFMSKVGKNISLVFDSFLVPALTDEQTGFGIFIPGLRLQDTPKKAIQFGLGVITFEDGTAPFPFIQWFRKIN